MRVDDKLNNVKGQLEYVNSVLSSCGLEEWEAKEYSDLSASYLEQIKELNEVVDGLNLEYGMGGW